MDVKLASDHYRRSLLVQDGLEIKCNVTVKVPNATLGKETERYHSLVEELSAEAKEDELLGSSILVNNSKNMD